jgi:type I restriction-modification system DNA methylase subunit
MTTPESAYPQIEKLVKKFKSLPAAERKNMNENATRQGYILPLFSALGWDTTDIHEVSPEEKVSRGWVDFSFRLGGVPRFFLETKKVREDLNDPRWVRQAVDYAWTKSVSWALLSDFEGLRVFNAEWRVDNPFMAEFLNFDLDSYLSDFERLWWLSRSETEGGRLSAEAENVGKKAKRLPVSLHLFDDLKQWRAALFKDFKGFNPLFTDAQIDAAVLRTLNRLIFIRTAEDRQVEPNLLQALVREMKDRKQFVKLSEGLGKLFREMDTVYNSELFAPHFSDGLYVTPSTLETVIEGLYERAFIHYNFNAIEADVLGTVYEQYLGTVVTESLPASETPSQPALITSETLNVQERRQKRKSQGIYYTPSFVTKYIVQQTIGRYLEENGFYPRPPRVLDMACGSGSFLIEAFDCLDRYLARQSGQAYGEQEGLHDQMRRLQILTQCIYGVDKDHQAVEVARLNLLLRALHSREHLPLLNNIYQGDSLQAETWQYFTEPMKEGGFDIIIGNPPYVRQETLGPEFKAYAQQTFTTYAGTADLYIYFIEQAHRLLKPGGYFGMIVSNKWIRSNYGKSLREFLKSESQLLEIVDFGELPVFTSAATFPAILITRKQKVEKQQFVYAPIKRLDFTSLPEEVKKVGNQLNEHALEGGNWTLVENQGFEILTKMIQLGEPLGEYINRKIFFGVKTGYDKAFVINKVTRDKLISLSSKSSELIKPYVIGDDVRKYHINQKERFLIVIPKGWTRANILIETPGKEITTTIAWEWMSNRYSSIANHLISYVEEAKKRQDKGEFWWELRACAYYSEFYKPKIIYPDIAKESRFAFDDSAYFPAATNFIIPTDDLFLLGVLNSSLAFYALKSLCPVLGDPAKGGRLRLKTIYIQKLPIPHINLSNPSEKSAHDEIVRLVEEILSLHKDLAAAEREKDDRRFSLQQRIAQVDREIDWRVYALYDLTEAEIRVVEGG